MLGNELLTRPKKFRHEGLPRIGDWVRYEQRSTGRIMLGRIHPVDEESPFDIDDIGNFVMIKVIWDDHSWNYAYWDNVEQFDPR